MIEIILISLLLVIFWKRKFILLTVSLMIQVISCSDTEDQTMALKNWKDIDAFTDQEDIILYTKQIWHDAETILKNSTTDESKWLENMENRRMELDKLNVKMKDLIDSGQISQLEADLLYAIIDTKTSQLDMVFLTRTYTFTPDPIQSKTLASIKEKLELLEAHEDQNDIDQIKNNIETEVLILLALEYIDPLLENQLKTLNKEDIQEYHMSLRESFQNLRNTLDLSGLAQEHELVQTAFEKFIGQKDTIDALAWKVFN